MEPGIDLSGPHVRHLLTHDGPFHADEVLATAVLATLWPEAAIIRTRNRAQLSAACADPATIVYDIGGQCAPGSRVFDHHQADPPRRADGTVFSAFGLIWRAFGHAWLRRIGIGDPLVNETHAAMDAGFVTAIDLIDNGGLSATAPGPVGAVTLPTLLSDLLPEGDDPAELDAGFAAAVEMARPILIARAQRIARMVAAQQEIAVLIAAQRDDPVLELPRGMPFARAVQAGGAAHLRFVLHPRAQEWVLYAIEASDGVDELRCPFPEAWSGLENEALAAVSGVADAVFCHRNRFLAVARSRAGAREMARRALIACGGGENSTESIE